jgi:putative aldouronate transport system permease protein
MKKNISMTLTVHVCLIIFCFLCLVPMILTISISITDNKSLATYGYQLIPRKISMDAYKLIFLDPQRILSGYKNSLIITIVGTVLNVFVTTLIAYPLSRKDFRLRNAISFYLFVTMLFSGGLVPVYILIVKYLHWKNLLIAIIIPAIAGPMNIFLMRVFFQDIPESLVEAAKIDGSSDYNSFFKIVLPLSKPAIATLTLMIALGYWNEAFGPMLYLDDMNKYPLQLILNNIVMFVNEIKNGTYLSGSGSSFNPVNVPSDGVMYGMMVVATAPMLLLFAFMQKYFVKGVAMGAVKG